MSDDVDTPLSDEEQRAQYGKLFREMTDSEFLEVLRRMTEGKDFSVIPAAPKTASGDVEGATVYFSAPES